MFRLILIESRLHRLVRPSPSLPPSLLPSLPPSLPSSFPSSLVNTSACAQVDTIGPPPSGTSVYVLLLLLLTPLLSLPPSLPPSSLPSAPLLPNDPQAHPKLEAHKSHTPPSLPPSFLFTGPLLPNDPQAYPQLEVRVLDGCFPGGVNPLLLILKKGGREGGSGCLSNGGVRLILRMARG